MMVHPMGDRSFFRAEEPRTLKRLKGKSKDLEKVHTLSAQSLSLSSVGTRQGVLWKVGLTGRDNLRSAPASTQRAFSILVRVYHNHGLTFPVHGPFVPRRVSSVCAASRPRCVKIYMMLVVTVHPVPKSSVAAGIFVSAFGASCSFLLWAYKAHYGRVLRSMVLLAVSFFFFFFQVTAAAVRRCVCLGMSVSR